MIVRFLAHRFKNYLKHFSISRYVVVRGIVNTVTIIKFFVIDEAEYFISYPLFFVISIEVVLHPPSQILDVVTTKLKKIVFDNSLNYAEERCRKPRVSVFAP